MLQGTPCTLPASRRPSTLATHTPPLTPPPPPPPPTHPKPLLTPASNPRPHSYPTTGTELLVRFDKRDAAGCLLALDISPEEAAAEPAVERRALLALHHCSHAWLKGEVAEPGQGYSDQELAAGLNRLALGDAHEADEAAEAAGEAAEQPQAARAEAGEGVGAGAGAGGGDVGREGGQAA